MENEIIRLSGNESMELKQAMEIKAFFINHFQGTETTKIHLLTETVAKYPCAIVPFYEFCKATFKSMPEFTSLKSVCSTYIALSWYGMGDDFKIKLMKKNFEILNSL